MAYSSLWTTSASVGLTMAKLSRIVPSCGTEGVWRRNQSHPISVKTLRLLLPFTDMSKCISSLCRRGEESWPAASKTGVEDPRSKHSEANCSSHLLLSSPRTLLSRLTATVQFLLEQSQPTVGSDPDYSAYPKSFSRPPL